MKICHVPFGFYPDPVGGTEIYVAALCRHLQERSVDTLVAAPGEEDAEYLHGALPVRRFRLSRVNSLLDLYEAGDEVAAAAFGHIVDEQKPNIVHLHAFTRGVSLQLVRATRRRGIPVVLTYHTPTVSCQRGTLLRWGNDICDGRLDPDLCTRCTLQGLGIPRPLAQAIGRLPAQAGRALGRTGRPGRAVTALRMRELMELRYANFRDLMREVDHIVAVCQWVRDLLLRNGVPAERVTVSRHGLPARPEESEPAEPLPAAATPLRIAFLGRLHPTKGADLVIRAILGMPAAPLRLDLYGLIESAAPSAYVRRLEALAARDRRITLLPPVPNDRVVSLLRDYHILAVPSRWLETGPLVVLEAFAAGTPVVGSRLGGIAEWIEHESNGLLIEPADEEGWRQAFHRLLQDRTLLPRLRSGVRAPRSMDQVAREMLSLYQTVLRCEGAHNRTIASSR